MRRKILDGGEEQEGDDEEEVAEGEAEEIKCSRVGTVDTPLHSPERKRERELRVLNETEEL